MKKLTSQFVPRIFVGLLLLLAGCNQRASEETPLFAGGTWGWWEEDGGDGTSLLFMKQDHAGVGKSGEGTLGFFTKVDKNTYRITTPKRASGSSTLPQGWWVDDKTGQLKMSQAFLFSFKGVVKIHNLPNQPKNTSFNKKDVGEDPENRILKIISISQDEMTAEFNGKTRKFFLVRLNYK